MIWWPFYHDIQINIPWACYVVHVPMTMISRPSGIPTMLSWSCFHDEHDISIIIVNVISCSEYHGPAILRMIPRSSLYERYMMIISKQWYEGHEIMISIASLWYLHRSIIIWFQIQDRLRIVSGRSHGCSIWRLLVWIDSQNGFQVLFWDLQLMLPSIFHGLTLALQVLSHDVIMMFEDC